MRRLLAVAAFVAVLLAWGIGRFGTTVPEARTPPRIAVLPMESFSPEPDDRYLAGGLHEELLTQLQRSGGIEVISGTSVARYEGSDMTIAEIADELDVDLLAESALLRDGNRVRVTVQVVEARTAAQIWAETYDRPLADVFAIQTDIAQRIARELRVSLGPGGEERPIPPTENPEAYAAYLEGMYHQRRSWRPEHSRRAVESFREAVRLDPGFAPAWGRLVVSRLNVGRGWRFRAERDSARVALERLKELAPSAPMTRWARGVSLYRHGHFDDALRELEAMRVESPGDADVIHHLGAVHRALGRWEESRQILLDALRLDPVNPSLLEEVSFAHRATGRLTEAKRYMSLAVSLDPSVAAYWSELVEVSLWEGDLAEARAVLDSAAVEPWELVGLRAQVARFERRPEVALEHLLAYPAEGPDKLWWALPVIRTAAAAGRSDLVHEYADTLRAAAGRRGSGGLPDGDDVVARTFFAVAQAHLGNHEEALSLLETVPPIRHALLRSQIQTDFAKILVVCRRHGDAVDLIRHLLATPGDDVSVPMLRLDPAWDPLRGRDDFETLLDEHADDGGR